MFDNISGKIKTLAVVTTIIGIIASVIIGIVVLVTADELAFLGIIVIILGSLFSWASSFLIYGFGELIENTQVIAHNTTKQSALTKSNLLNKTQSAPKQEHKKICPCCFHEVSQYDLTCNSCGQKLN